VATFTIDQGDTFTTTVTVTNAAGAAEDITGGTVKMFIFDRNGAQLHLETVISHTTPVSGITTITISKTDTATFPHGAYDYEIEYTSSIGEVNTVNKGIFVVEP
jgi:hypothetical protein